MIRKGFVHSVQSKDIIVLNGSWSEYQRMLSRLQWNDGQNIPNSLQQCRKENKKLYEIITSIKTNPAKIRNQKIFITQLNHEIYQKYNHYIHENLNINNQNELNLQEIRRNNNSNMRKLDTTWSWWNGKWINYDKQTSQYIENKYQLYLKQAEKIRNNTFCINLNTSYFENNAKLRNKYKIYFSAPNIEIDATSNHSRNNPKWKYDKDDRNKYFLQENHVIEKYRIVRRRCINNE